MNYLVAMYMIGLLFVSQAIGTINEQAYGNAFFGFGLMVLAFIIYMEKKNG